MESIVLIFPSDSDFDYSDDEKVSNELLRLVREVGDQRMRAKTASFSGHGSSMQEMAGARSGDVSAALPAKSSVSLQSFQKHADN
jgi:hypothetical protein